MLNANDEPPMSDDLTPIFAERFTRVLCGDDAGELGTYIRSWVRLDGLGERSTVSDGQKYLRLGSMNTILPNQSN